MSGMNIVPVMPGMSVSQEGLETLDVCNYRNA